MQIIIIKYITTKLFVNLLRNSLIIDNNYGLIIKQNLLFNMNLTDDLH